MGITMCGDRETRGTGCRPARLAALCVAFAVCPSVQALMVPTALVPVEAERGGLPFPIGPSYDAGPADFYPARSSLPPVPAGWRFYEPHPSKALPDVWLVRALGDLFPPHGMPDSWQVEMPPEGRHAVAHASVLPVLRITPLSSMQILLSGLLTMACWHLGSGAWRIKLQLGSLSSGWLAASGLSRIEHAPSSQLHSDALPRCDFEPAVDDRPFHCRIGRGLPPGSDGQCFLTDAAPRGPPEFV